MRHRVSKERSPEMAERRMTPAQISEAQRLARDWKASCAANSSLEECCGLSPSLEPDSAAWSARLGNAMAPPATSATDKEFIGDGAVVSYLNNKGDRP